MRCLMAPHLLGATQVADIGEGSFAKVTHCKLMLESSELDCAVKMLKPELFKNTQDVKMFIREGVTLKRIQHPCASICTQQMPIHSPAAAKST